MQYINICTQARSVRDRDLSQKRSERERSNGN